MSILFTDYWVWPSTKGLIGRLLSLAPEYVTSFRMLK